MIDNYLLSKAASDELGKAIHKVFLNLRKCTKEDLNSKYKKSFDALLSKLGEDLRRDFVFSVNTGFSFRYREEMLRYHEEQIENLSQDETAMDKLYACTKAAENIKDVREAEDAAWAAYLSHIIGCRAAYTEKYFSYLASIDYEDSGLVRNDALDAVWTGSRWVNDDGEVVKTDYVPVSKEENTA